MFGGFGANMGLEKSNDGCYMLMMVMKIALMMRRRRREEDGNEDDDNDDDVGLHKEKIEQPMWRLAARNDADFGAKVHFILENPTPCSFHPSGEGL